MIAPDYTEVILKHQEGFEWDPVKGKFVKMQTATTPLTQSQSKGFDFNGGKFPSIGIRRGFQAQRFNGMKNGPVVRNAEEESAAARAHGLIPTEEADEIADKAIDQKRKDRRAFTEKVVDEVLAKAEQQDGLDLDKAVLDVSDNPAAQAEIAGWTKPTDTTPKVAPKGAPAT